MRTDVTDPLDPVHKRAAAFRLALLSWYEQVSEGINRWEPRPCPPQWK